MTYKNKPDTWKAQLIWDKNLKGFLPIYQKEIAYWQKNYRWLSQLIIWLSLTVLPAIGATQQGTKDAEISYLTLFIWLTSIFTPLGVIILAQGCIIEEKLTQTLLWIFSKPVSASGFILGKFLSYAVFIGTIALGVPAIFIYLVVLVLGLPQQITFLNYLVAILLVYLLVLFNLAVTLMLEAIFNSIKTVTAIALFVFVGGASLNSNAQLSKFEPYSPFSLQRHAITTLVDGFPQQAWLSISVTVSLIISLLLISFWWMKRYEF
jgi:ABC-2 type transport system permease protein